MSAFPTPGRARDLARGAAAPVVSAAVAIGLLSAWVAAGGAGTVSTVARPGIEVTLATVPMPSLNPGPAGVPQPDADCYLTIRNQTGRADTLVSVSSSAAERVVLTRYPAGGLAVPAHGTLRLRPSGPDAVLVGGPRLLAGQQLPLTLTFRDAGQVKVLVTVTIPGAPAG